MLFTNFVSSVLTTVIFGVVLAQAQELAAGRYRIFNGDKYARSYPITHPGFDAPVTMSNQFAGDFGQWYVNPVGSGAYLIQNVAAGAGVYADQKRNAEVHAVLEKQTSWVIENKGSNGQDDIGSYVVKVPSKDLVWTSTPNKNGDNLITLKGSDGSAKQRFVFQLVY